MYKVKFSIPGLKEPELNQHQTKLVNSTSLSNERSKLSDGWTYRRRRKIPVGGPASQTWTDKNDEDQRRRCVFATVCLRRRLRQHESGRTITRSSSFLPISADPRSKTRILFLNSKFRRCEIDNLSRANRKRHCKRNQKFTSLSTYSIL